MSYLEKNLVKGEEVVYKADINWSIYSPSFLIFTIGIILMFVDFNLEQHIKGFFEGFQNWWLGAGVFSLGIYPFIQSYIIRNSTTLAITTNRVIYKRGLISRETDEFTLTKVESVLVEQGLLDRLMDMGNIIVKGTGGGTIPVNGLESPLEFRNQLNKML